MNDQVTYWELEIFAYVQVKAHDVDILPCSVDAWPQFEPLQDITCTQRTVLYYGMSEQLGNPCIGKRTFLLDFDQIFRSRYLLEM